MPGGGEHSRGKASEAGNAAAAASEEGDHAAATRMQSLARARNARAAAAAKRGAKEEGVVAVDVEVAADDVTRGAERAAGGGVGEDGERHTGDGAMSLVPMTDPVRRRCVCLTALTHTTLLCGAGYLLYMLFRLDGAGPARALPTELAAAAFHLGIGLMELGPCVGLGPALAYRLRRRGSRRVPAYCARPLGSTLECERKREPGTAEQVRGKRRRRCSLGGAVGALVGCCGWLLRLLLSACLLCGAAYGLGLLTVTYAQNP